jgi:ankyrin repeat protein
MTSIFDACKYGNLERLRDCIQQGLSEGLSLTDIVNVKHHDSGGQTLLNIAIIHHQYEIARELLRNGADPSIGDIDGNSALQYAICRDYFRIIDDLVSHQVDINKPACCKRTPLHRAILEAKFDIVDDLLKRGANYTMRDFWNRTPKEFAIVLETDQNRWLDITPRHCVYGFKSVINLLQSYEDSVEIKEPDELN